MASVILGLGLIIGLGVSMQWIAKILKIPGIILLLPAGMIVGPVLGLVQPEEIFGNSFFPLVTLGVGILLLNGGLNLRLRDLHPPVRNSVWRLITIGVILTLFVGTGAVLLLFGVSLHLAFLLAALLVVSGPTVVGPILSFARPREPVGSVLLWEGIIIDPIGAAIAVAAISVITSENPNPFLDLLLTIVTGVILGSMAALLYSLSDRTRTMPKGLSAVIALMLAIVAITAGELIFSEAGLFAALTMGLVLANQRLTPLDSIRVLTETIEPLIIGILFIMLAALVDLSAMAQYLLPALGLVAIYVLIARPLVSLLATHGLAYSRAEKIFVRHAPARYCGCIYSLIVCAQFSQRRGQFSPNGSNGFYCDTGYCSHLWARDSRARAKIEDSRSGTYRCCHIRGTTLGSRLGSGHARGRSHCYVVSSGQRKNPEPR